MGRWFRFATAGFFASLGACQLIAGLEDRSVVDDASTDVVIVDVIKSDAIADAATDTSTCEKCGTNACVDLNTSNAHCGYCGHACGSCAAGICPSTTLASSLSSDSYAMATDGAKVYYATPQGVEFVTTNGASSGEVIAGVDAQDMILISDTLYLAVADGVFSVNTNGSNFKVLYTRDFDAGLGYGIGIAANANTLFWQTQCGIFSLPIDGGGANAIVPEDITQSMNALAVDTSNVYFLDFKATFNLESIPQLGGQRSVLTSTFATGYSVRYSNGLLYWGTQDALFKSPTDGGASTQIVNSVDIVHSVEVHGSRLFWVVTGTLPNTGSVVTVPLAGGSPATLAKNLNLPEHVVADDTSVYWFEANAIKKVNY